jgi:ubiquinone/menaquinone biosynthesis C-methylase UbiE
MSKKILDACCGSKMFWFDKNNPNVEFCDKRTLKKTEYYKNRYIEVNPDTVYDFTNLPFDDESFHLVVFDPPHLKRCGEKSWMFLKYGKLSENWQQELKKGFSECVRVLAKNGVLIFKWNETQIKLSEVLSLCPLKPLFGNKKPKQSKTHWICFMKYEDRKE